MKPARQLRALSGSCLMVLLLWLWGCAPQLKAAAARSFMKDVSAATARHDDLELVVQAVPTYLLLLEGLLHSDPDNPQILIALAETYTSYGTLVEVDDPERARRLYRRAMAYGLSALGHQKGVAPLLGAPYAEFAQIRQRLKPKDAHLVFWAALSWGTWISTSTESMEALADLPKVILLMEWVVQQDETIYFGSPHVFLGVYHSALPPALGGDPPKALYHFDRALEISQHSAAMVYVQKARFYARQVFDRDLYESLLRQALELPIDRIPELTLQNVAARKMARKLLEETDAFF